MSLFFMNKICDRLRGSRKETTMNQSDPKLLARLQRPEGKVDVVLDTDTYNEIDDQFALSYLIKSDDKLNLKALYAAPFWNGNSENPADGMEKSYQEIHKILKLIGKPEYSEFTYRGSTQYLPDEKTPVISDAANHLAKLAMEYTPEKPLYVVAIGAITNVASAVLINPEIIDRIVLVWLGGTAHHWPHNREFNCFQDVAAIRVLTNCGLAFVQLPCAGVVSSFSTSKGELEMHLRGKNELCDYLIDNTIHAGSTESPYSTWTRVIWDVTAVAWLLDEKFMDDYLTPTPIFQYDDHYSFDPTRHLMRYVYNINRDALFEDLFRKLAK